MKITDEMVLRGLNATARPGSEAPDLSYWGIEATVKMRAAFEVRPHGTVADAEDGEALTYDQYLEGTE